MTCRGRTRDREENNKQATVNLERPGVQPSPRARQAARESMHCIRVIRYRSFLARLPQLKGIII